MCGLAGIYNFQREREVNPQLLEKMIKILHHRGPDGYAVKVLNHVGLAHSRLKIIDLSTGDQPIYNEDQTVWTVFNGEIFNYIELRDDLIKKGHIFYTKSDTEVIVHLYEEYGTDFVNQLNGQFAIVLYDIKINRLLLIRDRIGICPLFYTKTTKSISFASEIKSLLMASSSPPALNKTSLQQIFTYWTTVTPNTIFEDIYEISPGQMLIIDNNNVKTFQYWDWEFPVNNDYHNGAESVLINEFKELLLDATKIRLRSDVPVGAYLSGGLDSSSIVSLINNHTDASLRTFSIGFDETDYDETEYQNLFVKSIKTNHSYLKCTNDDISRNFIDTIWHSETPLLRTAPVPMKLLSRLVKDHNYKVVLTGEGADEVLGGYDVFKEAKIRHFWAKYPNSTCRPTLLKRLYPYLDLSRGAYLKEFFGQGLDAPDNYSFSHLTRWSSTEKCKSFFSESMRLDSSDGTYKSMLDTLPDAFGKWHYFNQAQYIESKSLMNGYLLCSQGDRMLMANSIEGRFPFLDHRVIEFANRIHPKLKMKALNEKYLLKKAMSSELPKNILNRYKQPYRAPNVPAFFTENNNEFVNNYLNPSKIKEYDYFDPNKVSHLLKKIKKGRAVSNNDNMALVGILSTQVWHHLFIESFDKKFI